jgi:UDP-glucose 4-epimerase
MDEFLALAYAKQLALPVVIVRLFNTVGPRQTGRYGMVVPRFVRQALAGEPVTVYGDGQQTRSFCHVGDVVRAIIGLVDEPDATGDVFNVGSTEEVTIEALARRTVALARSSSEIVFVPYDEAYEVGFEDMRRRVPDITKIRSLIGWEPRVDLDGILGSVIAYEREHGRV